jgi:hypothetical protein
MRNKARLVPLAVGDSSLVSLPLLAASVLLLTHPRNAWGPRAGPYIYPARRRLRWLWGHTSPRDIQCRTHGTMQQGYRGLGVHKWTVRMITREHGNSRLIKTVEQRGHIALDKERHQYRVPQESEANIQRISFVVSRMQSPMERPLFSRFVWVS